MQLVHLAVDVLSLIVFNYCALQHLTTRFFHLVHYNYV